MKKTVKFLDDNLEAIMLVILLAAISIVMFLQIIMQIVGSPLTWPEEFCCICFVYSGFICFSYCQKRKAAIRIDVLLNFMPEKLRKAIDVLGQATMFAFYVFLLTQSFGLLQTTAKNGSKTSALQLPLVVEYFSLTLGMGLAAFRSVQQFVRFLMNRKGGEAA